MEQMHKTPSHETAEHEVEPTPDNDTVAEGLAAAAKKALDGDTDDVLDEIDDVLEANAEEFVRGFVQKGGQ